MKQLILLLSTCISFAACSKEDLIFSSNYTPAPIIMVELSPIQNIKTNKMKIGKTILLEVKTNVIKNDYDTLAKIGDWALGHTEKDTSNAAQVFIVTDSLFSHSGDVFAIKATQEWLCIEGKYPKTLTFKATMK